LSDQSMANMLSHYQSTQLTHEITPARPYNLTPEDRAKLGIGADMSWIANFDPTKPNWNAQSWQVSKPQSSAGVFGNILGDSNFLGAAGVIGSGLLAGYGINGLNGTTGAATNGALTGNSLGVLASDAGTGGLLSGAGSALGGAAGTASGDAIQQLASAMAQTGTSTASEAAAALGYPSADAMLGAFGGGSLLSGTSASGLSNLATNTVGANGAGLLPTSGGSNVATNSLIPGVSNGSLLSGGLNLVGGLVAGNAATNAAQTSADAQLQAAKIAADAAKFKPVGVTTNFGSSRFGYDANGNLNSAGYQLSPQLQAQQNQIMAGTNPLLAQAQNAPGQTVQMGDAAQRMMTLGNGYLNSTPQEQAAKWMQDQQALLAQGDQNSYAAMQAQLQAQGRGGLMTGGGNGFAAANPEMNAYYNAMQQRNLGLAANATQAGQQYATYGAGLVGAGGEMLNNMYGTQSSAYNPYSTALGQAQNIEGLGQNAFTMGANLGSSASQAGANAGRSLLTGGTGAANTMQAANAYSPTALALGNLAKLFSPTATTPIG
jgi:hypothetical protein